MMTFRMRKNAARVLLPFVFVFFTVIPVRQSQAFVALMPIGIALRTVAGLTFTATDLAGLAIALAGVGTLLFADFSEPGGSSVAIPMQDQVLHPTAVVPVPYAPPMVPQTSISNYSGGPSTACFYKLSVGDLAACIQLYLVGTGATNVSCIETSLINIRCNYSYSSQSSTANYLVLAGSTLGCPVAYAVSGSTCVLVNSRLMQDNRQDWVRQGNVYSRYAGDLYGTASAVAGTTNVANDSVSMVGTNSGGNPTSITAVANSDGGTTIMQSIQKTDASGNTYIEVRTITLDSAGNLVSSSGSSVAGSLNPSLPANNGGATLVPGVPGTITPNPTSTAPLNFPADYARTGEPAAAAAPLGAKLDTLHNDLLNFTVPVAVDPVASMDERISAMGTEPAVPQISWMPSVLAGAGTCHALVFNIDVVGGLLNGMTGASSIDICDKLDIIRQIFGYMIFMATSIYIFRTFMLSVKGVGV